MDRVTAILMAASLATVGPRTSPALAVAAPQAIPAATPPRSQAADRLAKWDPLIAEAASRFGLPADWIRRVMRAESGGRTTLGGRPITSAKGATGLMQLMPGTWAEMASLHGLGADPYGPRDNILAGAAYLRLMFDRFGYPGLFAAYNAGPERYAAWLRGRRPLPAETRLYLARVLAIPFSTSGEASGPLSPVSQNRSGSPPESLGFGLFFALRGSHKAEDSAATKVVPGAIFARLHRAEAPQ